MRVTRGLSGKAAARADRGDNHGPVALTAMDGDRPLRIVPDRTFVDASGTRWIVDFKTSVHRGSDLDTFLDREVERHRPQLDGYAKAWNRLDAGPIRLGLYWTHCCSASNHANCWWCWTTAST